MSLGRPPHFTVSRFDGKKLLVLVSIMVVAMMIDSEIGFVSDFLAEMISSPAGIALFISIAIIFAVIQYFILGYVKELRKEGGTAKALHLSLTHMAVTIAQYVLVAIIAFVILQMLILSQYNTIILYPVLFISGGVWIITLALLSRALLSWYRSRRAEQESKKSGILVLVLSLSMVAYVVLGIITLVSNIPSLQEQLPVVTSSDVAYFVGFEPEDLVSQLVTLIYAVTSIAYVLNWVGTVMLLRPYIQRLGTIKFWAIMGVVMVYYLVSFPLFVLGYFNPAGETDVAVMNNILIFSVGAVLSGILFGAAFLSIARTLKRGSALRNYMTIAAYGMVLFYVTLQAQVSQAAYPPYGLISTACVGLSTYLIYIGLYSSAVTVSQDLALRQSIRKSVTAQSKLLDSIGTAQMETELQRRVLTVAKKASGDMAEKTGVEASMNEDEIKDYIERVMKELENKR
jgi:hypothetical protein